MSEVNIREVAVAQRRLIWAFVAATLGIVPILLIVTIPFLLYCVWTLAAALRVSTGARIAYMVFVLIPLLAVLPLLHLNRRATKALQAAGVSVGLMGAKVEDFPPSPPTHVKCPDCAELVLREARVCKHCGRKLVPQ